MAIKKLVEIENTNVRIVDDSAFDIEKLALYKKEFQSCKEANIIKTECDFDDILWILDDSLTVHNINFEFNEVLFKKEMTIRKVNTSYSEFIIALKAFVLALYGNVALENIKSIFNIIKNLIVDTDFFSKEKVEIPVQQYRDLTNTYRHIFIIDFLNFFPMLNEDKQYTELLKELLLGQKHDTRQRVLGSYETMFKFNDVMNSFIDEATAEEKLRYFPIILWWKISTIIPIRTVEFTVIPKECCSKKDGKFYITVMRCTQKSFKDEEIEKSYKLDKRFESQTLEVTEDIYNMVSEYKQIVDKFDEIDNFYGDYSQFLQNEDEERQFFLSNRGYWQQLNNSGKWLNSHKAHHEFLSSRVLVRLLEDFLNNIVSLKYGFEIIEKTNITTQIVGNAIEKIQLMDTRHYAFANMALQGVSPIVMKYMGGHKDIDSSYHYYSHLPNFVKSYTYSLAKKMSYNKIKKQIPNSADYTSLLKMNYTEINEREVHLKQLFNNALDDSFIEINNVKCYSKNFPKECMKVDNNCFKCPYGYPTKSALKNISSEIESIDKEMDSVISTLESIVGNYSNIINADEQIKTQSNKMVALINNKASIISDYVI